MKSGYNLSLKSTYMSRKTETVNFIACSGESSGALNWPSGRKGHIISILGCRPASHGFPRMKTVVDWNGMEGNVVRRGAGENLRSGWSTRADSTVVTRIPVLVEFQSTVHWSRKKNIVELKEGAEGWLDGTGIEGLRDEIFRRKGVWQPSPTGRPVQVLGYSFNNHSQKAWLHHTIDPENIITRTTSLQNRDERQRGHNFYKWHTLCICGILEVTHQFLSPLSTTPSTEIPVGGNTIDVVETEPEDEIGEMEVDECVHNGETYYVELSSGDIYDIESGNVIGHWEGTAASGSPTLICDGDEVSPIPTIPNTPKLPVEAVPDKFPTVDESGKSQVLPIPITSKLPSNEGIKDCIDEVLAGDSYSPTPDALLEPAAVDFTPPILDDNSTNITKLMEELGDTKASLLEATTELTTLRLSESKLRTANSQLEAELRQLRGNLNVTTTAMSGCRQSSHDSEEISEERSQGQCHTVHDSEPVVSPVSRQDVGTSMETSTAGSSPSPSISDLVSVLDVLSRSSGWNGELCDLRSSLLSKTMSSLLNLV